MTLKSSYKGPVCDMQHLIAYIFGVFSIFYLIADC